jgi:hypothetical protein
MANYCLLKGSATGTRIVPGSPAADVAAIVDLRPIGGPEVVARETTTAGQTPADLAARLVADLNGNSALSSRGVHCRTRGNLPDNQRAVICTQPLGVPVDAGTGGAIAVACQPNDTGVAKANEAGTQAVVDTALTKVDNPVNDSTGCSSFSACNVLPPVAPALPPWALGLLGGSLLAGAVIVLRRRSQLFRPV